MGAVRGAIKCKVRLTLRQIRPSAEFGSPCKNRLLECVFWKFLGGFRPRGAACPSGGKGPCGQWAKELCRLPCGICKGVRGRPKRLPRLKCQIRYTFYCVEVSQFGAGMPDFRVVGAVEIWVEMSRRIFSRGGVESLCGRPQFTLTGSGQRFRHRILQDAPWWPNLPTHSSPDRGESIKIQACPRQRPRRHA